MITDAKIFDDDMSAFDPQYPKDEPDYQPDDCPDCNAMLSFQKEASGKLVYFCRQCGLPSPLEVPAYFKHCEDCSPEFGECWDDESKCRKAKS